MKAPDRIWVESTLQLGGAVLAVATEQAPPRFTEYLRATPELLALIEAAKEVGLEPARQAKLIMAALAFNATQDHPDAGYNPPPLALPKTDCLSMHRDDKNGVTAYVRLDFDHYDDAQEVFEWIDSVIGQMLESNGSSPKPGPDLSELGRLIKEARAIRQTLQVGDNPRPYVDALHAVNRETDRLIRGETA